jgi:soluble lytic murein transglycosylase-like protein
MQKATILTSILSIATAGTLFFGGLIESNDIPKTSPQPLTHVQRLAEQPAVDPVISQTVREFNQDLTQKEARTLAKLIEKTAERHDVDPLLVTALVSQESAFDADAESPVGAIGLGQLMPFTADELGVDPYDPADNLEGAVKYLAQNLDTWAHTGDPVSLALASYNAGPGAVESYDGVPPYEETEHYVEVITDRYDDLKSNSLASRNGRRSRS